MTNPMNPFEGKIFTTVDEGYDVNVFRTAKSLQHGLLNCGKFFDEDGNSLVPYEILDILIEKRIIRLYEKDSYGVLSSDWVYRVEVH